MIDVETQRPLTVNTEGDAGPYLMVPVDQLDVVVEVLRREGISHQIDDDAIELDGKAVIAVINFGIGANSGQIQRVLDAA